MKNERYNRRMILSACGGIGVASLSGCLRLAEQGDSDGGDDGVQQEFELVSTWDQGANQVTTGGGDFFTGGFSTLKRISSNGQQIFETGEIEGEQWINLTFGWRNSLHVDDGGVYAGAKPDDDAQGAYMYAFEPDTGEQRWMREEPADELHNNIRATTSTEDLVIYASMSSGSGSDQKPIIRAVDPATGSEEWNIQYSEGFVTDLTTRDNHLVVQHKGTKIYDLSDQDLITSSDIFAGFTSFRKHEDTLYVAADNVHSMSIPSGEVRWSTSNERSINTPASVGENGVFVGTESGSVIGYDTDSGEKLWENRVDGVINQPVQIYDRAIWVGTERGTLLALDIASGNKIYKEEVAPSFKFAVLDGTLIDTERQTAFEIQRL